MSSSINLRRNVEKKRLITCSGYFVQGWNTWLADRDIVRLVPSTSFLFLPIQNELLSIRPTTGFQQKGREKGKNKEQRTNISATKINKKRKIVIEILVGIGISQIEQFLDEFVIQK